MAARIPAQEFGHDRESPHPCGWADRWEQIHHRERRIPKTECSLFMRDTGFPRGISIRPHTRTAH